MEFLERITNKRNLKEVRLIRPAKRRCFKPKEDPAQKAKTAAPVSSACHFYSSQSSSIKIDYDEENHHAFDNVPTNNDLQYIPLPLETSNSNQNARLENHNVEELTIKNFKSQLNGHCFVTDVDGKSSLLISFLPTKNIIVCGCAIVEILLGRVSILGHLVKEGDAVPVFAPQKYPSIAIQGSCSKSAICSYRKVKEKFVHFNECTEKNSSHDFSEEDECYQEAEEEGDILEEAEEEEIYDEIGQEDFHEETGLEDFYEETGQELFHKENCYQEARQANCPQEAGQEDFDKEDGQEDFGKEDRLKDFDEEDCPKPAKLQKIEQKDGHKGTEATEQEDASKNSQQEDMHEHCKEANSYESPKDNDLFEKDDHHEGTAVDDLHKYTEESYHEDDEEIIFHKDSEEANLSEFNEQGFHAKAKESNETNTNGSVVSEAFIKKIHNTYLKRYATSSAKDKLKSLNLVVGKEMIVVRLREVPLMLLGRALRKLYPSTVKPDHLTPTVVACRPNSRGLYHAFRFNGMLSVQPARAMNLALPVYISPSWQKVTQQLTKRALAAQRDESSQIRVVVVGPTRSGKKTYTRYLINRLLAAQNGTSTPYCKLAEPPRCRHENPTSDVKPKGVCVIDLNLVRPMQCFPGTVSLSRYIAPVFGPAYEYGVSHVLRDCKHASQLCGSRYVCDNEVNFSDQRVILPHEIKTIFLGKPDTLFMKYELMEAVKSLCQTAEEECANEPLVFSFPSIQEYYERTWFAQFVEIIKPTHVVHLIAPSYGTMSNIMSTHVSSKVSLGCDIVDKLARRFDLFKNRTQSPKESGVCPYGYNYRLGIDSHELHEICYQYAGVPTVRGTFYKNISPPSKLEQNIAIASYFSALWPYNAPTLDSRSLMKPYIAPYDEIAIEIKFGMVRLQDVVPTLERRAMVALCSVDDKFIRHTDPGFPNEIVYRLSSPGNENSTFADQLQFPSYTLHGWAIVQRVDYAQKWIFLLVPRCFCPLLEDTVNALVMPHMNLPLNIDKLFYNDHLANYRSIVPRGPWNYVLRERVKKSQ